MLLRLGGHSPGFGGGGVEVGEGEFEAGELCGVEALEDVEEEDAGDVAHGADGDAALFGEEVADDAPVRRILFAPYEILADEAVDVSGDGGGIHAELLGEGADGEAIVVAEDPEEANLGEGEAVLGPAVDAEDVDNADGVTVGQGDPHHSFELGLADAEEVGGFGGAVG